MASRESKNSALLSAISRVRDRIAQAEQGHLRMNSGEDTKAALIEPLLKTLGWDVSDLEHVRREYRHKGQSNPVDYALLIKSKPRVLVEAKQLGTRLQDRKFCNQLITYASAAGVEWCVLTDGDKYYVYNAHAPFDLDGKLFLTARVSDGSAEVKKAETLQLLSRKEIERGAIDDLWKNYQIALKIQTALENLFRKPSRELLHMVHEKWKDLSTKQIGDALQKVRVHIDGILEFPPVPPAESTVRWSVYQEHGKEWLDIDDEKYELRYAKDILIYTAEWLIGKGKLQPEHCPVVLTRGWRGHVNTEPVHLDGNKFRGPHELSNGLWLETHASRDDLEKHARRLLEWAGYAVTS